MQELRIIIAGSREFNDFTLLSKSVTNIISNLDIEISKIRIISGTARGADQLGEKYAINMGYEISKFYPNWDGLGKKAGYIRNIEMAKYAVLDNSIGILIAFWNGKSKGTKHMIDLSKKYGLEVHVINF